MAKNNSQSIQQEPECQLLISNGNSSMQLDVYKRDYPPGLTKSKAFEEKQLTRYAVNVGWLCGNNCGYCSTASVSWRFRAKNMVGRSPYELGYAVVNPNADTAILKAAEAIPEAERGWIQMCTLTDAWSPEARQHNLGRKIAKGLLEMPGWRIRVLTKNHQVQDDFDLFKQYPGRVTVGLSLTGTVANQAILRAIEPNSSTISERMEALCAAHAQGIDVYGMLCPLMPGISDSPADVQQLVQFVHKVGAKEVWAENYNPRGTVDRVVEQLRNAGYATEADGVDRIRKKSHRSPYVLQSIRNLQQAMRETYGDAGKLKFLLYPSNLTDADKAELKKDDEGVIWLRKDKDKSSGKKSATGPTGTAPATQTDAASPDPAAPTVITGPKTVHSSTSQAEQQARNMLMNPDMLDEISDDLKTIGLAGERKLGQFLYLIGTSRLLKHPLSAIIVGSSSSGKSKSIATVAKLFPHEEMLNAQSTSPLAFLYMENGALTHTFVVAGERPRKQGGEEKDAHRVRRELQSEGRVSRIVNGKVILREGPISFVESTSASIRDIFEDDLNRCLILKPDETPEQTRRIMERCARDKSLRAAEYPQIIEKHQAAQRMLRGCRIVIPFSPRLVEHFEETRIETRRTFPEFLSLIEAVALLFQYQRLVVPQTDAYLPARAADYELARELVTGPHIHLEGVKSDAAQELCLRMNSWAREVIFTAREVAQRDSSVKDESTIRKHLKSLCERGFVERMGKLAGQGKTERYRLTDKASDLASLQGLPAAGEVCEPSDHRKTRLVRYLPPANEGDPPIEDFEPETQPAMADPAILQPPTADAIPAGAVPASEVPADSAGQADHPAEPSPASPTDAVEPATQPKGATDRAA